MGEKRKRKNDEMSSPVAQFAKEICLSLCISGFLILASVILLLLFLAFLNTSHELEAQYFGMVLILVVPFAFVVAILVSALVNTLAYISLEKLIHILDWQLRDMKQRNRL